MTTILIADDNAQNIYLLETLLKKYGHTIVSVSNGAEALASAQDNPPDILVTDILMPEMDGFELCRRWKSHEVLKHIPFIFYTATYVDLKDEQFALSLGADRFVIKPQQPEALIAIINDVLEKFAVNNEIAPNTPQADEKEVLQQYNEVLFRKLENKIDQLETEIDKQKIITEALKESKEKYHDLVNQSPDGIFVVNFEGKFIAVNRIMCEKLKYSEDELLSMSIWDIVPAQYSEQLRMRISGLFNGKTPEGASEYTVRGKDGEMLQVEVLSAPFYEGQKLIGFQSIARDISDRKEAEIKLRLSEERYRTVVENASEAIVVIQDDKIRFANPMVYSLTGYPYGQPLSQNFMDLIHPDDRASIEYRYASRIKGEMPAGDRSFRIIDCKQQIKWIQLSTALIQWENRPAVLTFMTDVTERKHAEEKLEKSYLTLKKTLNDAINTMAKIVELRDPYTSGHQMRVAQLATALAREIQINGQQIENIRMAAVIHDIGKMYVPSDILNKPGKLSSLEFKLIKAHARNSYDIVVGMDFPHEVAVSIHQHHERLNGSGYPGGLHGDEILQEARILAVADVVEAMSSHRPYRPALGVEKALTEISSHKNELYDAEIVDACLKLFREKNFSFG